MYDVGASRLSLPASLLPHVGAEAIKRHHASAICQHVMSVLAYREVRRGQGALTFAGEALLVGGALLFVGGRVGPLLLVLVEIRPTL